MSRKLIFLLGGARSGKSRYAEQWARGHGRSVLFVATAQAFDDEMRTRITRHREERPAEWDTLEVPTDVAKEIAAQAAGASYDTIIVDCLTLLASNVLLSLSDDCSQDDANEAILHEIDALLNVYRQSESTWLIISNEVGMGIVPPTHLGRLYRDALGYANQRIAASAGEVLLLVAGLAWPLKQPD